MDLKQHGIKSLNHHGVKYFHCMTLRYIFKFDLNLLNLLNLLILIINWYFIRYLNLLMIWNIIGMMDMAINYLMSKHVLLWEMFLTFLRKNKFSLKIEIFMLNVLLKFYFQFIDQMKSCWYRRILLIQALF